MSFLNTFCWQKKITTRQVVRSYGIASPEDSPKTGSEEHPTEALWAQDDQLPAAKT